METNKENVTDVTENIETKKENISLKQMSRIAAIAGGVLGAMLVISIIVSNVVGLKQLKDSINVEVATVTELQLKAKDFFKVDDKTAKKVKFDTSAVDLNKVGEYKAIAKCDGKEYTITVIVEDTTAPKVELTGRYVFTNNVTEADLSTMFESIQDASKYTTKLIRFEHAENLKELDEKALNSLTEQINTHATEEQLLALGSEEVPTEEGVYRAVIEIADAYGNATYEEVIVILDTTGAKIEDAPDKTITVSKEKLSEEPEVDKLDYIIKDNVDGKIATENITTELELRDEAKHEWLVHVSYTDRAGNDSKADFLIIVKEAKNGSTQTGNGGTSNNGGSSNQSGSSDSNTNNTPANKQDVSTWVPTDDESVISPYMQMLIDAGYGNVVDWGNGSYGVLVHADYTANGKDGYDILKDYLAEKDLEIVKSNAGIIDEDDDWYFYKAGEVRELITADEEAFWD